MSVHLAGSAVLGPYNPVQLFAGEADVITDNAIAGVDFAQYEVAAISNAGDLIKFDPESVDPNAKIARVIIAVPVTAGQSAPYYIAGVFNVDALIWPATLTEYTDRQEAFLGSNIHISRLYGKYVK